MLKIIKEHSFWAITGLETLIVGVIPVIIFYHFNDHLPSLFLEMQMPVVSPIMTLIGLATLITLKRTRIWVIIFSTMVWAYMMVSFALEIFDPASPFLAVPLMLAVLCGFVVLRILVTAWKENPDKLKEARHEN